MSTDTFGAGERVTFPHRLSSGPRVFAEAGDSGTVLKYWPVKNYYTVINDTAYPPDSARFNCFTTDVVQERENNDTTY